MIVVDTSALIALLQLESRAEQIADVLETEDRVVISAGTMAEALIVAGQRNLDKRIEELIEKIGIEVHILDSAGCKATAKAYSTWGKGVNPARLNFGDCFAYALAKAHGAPLLYVGNDFAKTDIVSAMDR